MARSELFEAAEAMARSEPFGRHTLPVALVAAVVLVGLVLPGAAALFAAPPPVPSGTYLSSAPSALGQIPFEPVHYTEPGVAVRGASALGSANLPSMFVLLTIGFANQSRLSQLLTALSDTGSPAYHRYLSATQFDREFSPSAATYGALERYVRSEGATSITTYSDRATLTFEAASPVVGTIFHTVIDDYQLGSRTYYAPTSLPELPQSLAASVVGVQGLSSFSTPTIAGFTGSAVHVAPSNIVPVASPSTSGYLAPPTVNGVQYAYGPDLQVAYDEQSLLAQFGDPADEVVATILWGGVYGGGGPSFCSSLSTGQDLGSYVPSDVYGYFNETMPFGESHPQIFGVPLGGAASPGRLASCDSTGSTLENTLDLEMIGSTAPGASIYDVYGPTSSSSNMDAAFSYVLNPTNTPALENVSVISNSWGAQDTNDSAFYQDLEEAQVRGISVLASSGDSGDNPQSSNWQGSDAVFPASMAYNTFGVTAVGGTTVTLNAATSSPTFLHISNQVVWYISPQAVRGGGPNGSSGGISTVFSEPSWQIVTSANGVIGGAGRGVPDIGAIANNTLITYSYQGVQYRATNASSSGAFESVWGTSISCPVEAGIVAEIDHVLRAQGQGNLGFLDPGLYALANEEYRAPASGGSVGYEQTGNYLSALPTLPLVDVVLGANYLNHAQYGYDLVTGWGSLDAYNYSMYFVTLSSQGLFGHLSGVEDRFNLSRLSVTSYLPGGAVNPSSNASIQQNFFVANSFGAPVYWIQNVIYINGTAAGWSMNYTGWVALPFYGLYQSETIYTYNFPATGVVVTTPASWTITSWLSSSVSGSIMNFQVNGQLLQLPVPGASFIIGSLSYSYSWQGVTYTNGPFPNNPAPGGLAPQFGLVGGPTNGIGHFQSPTAGALAVEVEPYGSSSYVPAATETFGLNVDQTAEQAQNLVWTSSGSNSWTLGVSSGSGTQGIVGYQAAGSATYPVAFAETGLPNGTSWSVTLNGATMSSVTSTITFAEENGTYGYTVGAVSGYTATPASGLVQVIGSPQAVRLAFAPGGGGGGGGSSSGFLGLPGQTGYYLLGGVLLVILVGVVAGAAARSGRRRRGGAPGPLPPAPPSSPSSRGPRGPPWEPPGPPPPYTSSLLSGAAGLPPGGDAVSAPASLPGSYSQDNQGGTRSRFCASCGKPYTLTDRFCTACGQVR